MKQPKIAAALGVTSGAVSQWLTRAQLPTLLDRGAEAYGFGGQVWTCQRVVDVIPRTFGVTYDPSPVGCLLHSLG